MKTTRRKFLKALGIAAVAPVVIASRDEVPDWWNDELTPVNAFETYDVEGVRDDLSKVIYNIDPERLTGTIHVYVSDFGEHRVVEPRFARGTPP